MFFFLHWISPGWAEILFAGDPFGRKRASLSHLVDYRVRSYHMFADSTVYQGAYRVAKSRNQESPSLVGRVQSESIEQNRTRCVIE